MRDCALAGGGCLMVWSIACVIVLRLMLAA